jgi:hypothetical protein
MNSECESHYRAGGRDRRAVEGNCVAAMRGEEQPETEGWSQTKVNSIRHVQRASLLGKGEACRASGESVTVQGLPILETGRCGCGWSGNDRKGAWDKWRARSGSRREGRAAVRAFIVAMKPGNAGGAKGRRKMKTPETVQDQNLIDCREAKTRECNNARFGPATGVWRPSWERDACESKDTLDQYSFTALVPICDQPLPLWVPSTGEPDAGDPPVRFGGRSGAGMPRSYPYHSKQWLGGQAAPPRRHSTQINRHSLRPHHHIPC